MSESKTDETVASPSPDQIAQAFDAGWAAHRDGIHWKRGGLADDELK
jgi:hypothetical protein